LLRIGEGTNGKGYEFSQIGTFESLSQSVEAEAKKLEKQLAQLDGLKSRLEVINNELGLGIKKRDQDIGNAKRTLI
jgi:hypothetical protein